MLPPITNLTELWAFIRGKPILPPKDPPRQVPPKDPIPLEDCAKMMDRLRQLERGHTMALGATVAFASVNLINGVTPTAKYLSMPPEQVRFGEVINDAHPGYLVLPLASFFYSRYLERQGHALADEIRERCRPPLRLVIIRSVEDPGNESNPEINFEAFLPWPLRPSVPTVRGEVIERDFTPELVATLAAIGGVAAASLRMGAVGMANWYWHVAWGL